MLFKVKVFSDSDRSKVVMRKNDELEVYVREKARDNEANKAVCRVLSSYFKIPKRGIRIIKGGKERNKIIKISGADLTGKQLRGKRI